MIMISLLDQPPPSAYIQTRNKKEQAIKKNKASYIRKCVELNKSLSPLPNLIWTEYGV